MRPRHHDDAAFEPPNAHCTDAAGADGAVTALPSDARESRAEGEGPGDAGNSPAEARTKVFGSGD